MSAENNTNWGNPPVKTQNIDGTRQKRPPLSAEEIERRRLAKEKAEERKREKRETFFVRAVFAFGVYLLCCLLITAFVASLYLTGGGEEYNALDIVDSKGEVLYTQEDEAFIIGNTPYISAEGLATLYDFTLAGDKQQVTIHFHNIGQSLSLYKDSSAVMMNGEQVRLNAPILFTNDYLIPLELIKNYFSGAMIKYDSEKGRATLSRVDKDSFSLSIHQPEETPIPG